MAKREISKEFASACAKGDLAAIRANLRQGVNNPDAKGSTPIHIAAFSNKAEAVKLLISRGSNLNGTDADGNTPLHLAVMRDCGDIVRILLFNGALPSITKRNEEGLKPREVAPKTAKFKGQIDIVLRELNVAKATDARWGSSKPPRSDLIVKKTVMSPEEISSSYSNYNLSLEVLLCTTKLRVRCFFVEAGCCG